MINKNKITQKQVQTSCNFYLKMLHILSKNMDISQYYLCLKSKNDYLSAADF